MPQFPWQRSLYRSNGSQSNHPTHPAQPDSTSEQQNQYRDLPAFPNRVSSIARSATVVERQGHYLDNRRSIAHFPRSTAGDANRYSPGSVASEFHDQPSRAQQPIGITRSRTVVYRDANRGRDIDPVYETASSGSPKPLWSPDFQQLPSPSEQLEQQQEPDHYRHDQPHSIETSSMNSNIAGGKTSSDSGSATGLDRWSQRRLQRLNTEQGFREQRQGVGGLGQGAVLSPTPSTEHVFSAQTQGASSNQYSTPATALQQQQHDSVNAQPQTLHQQNQPQLSYPTSRSASNAGLAGHQPSNNNNNSHSRSPNNYVAQSHDSSQQQSSQYSSSDSQYPSQTASRPSTQQPRSYQQSSSSANAIAVEADSTPMPHSNGASTAVKPSRPGGSNRQSIHNDATSREVTNAQQQAGQSAQGASRSRTQQQPLPTSEDMSEDDVNQLLKEHRELREKYTKVKRFFFEKEDQVKQLQNSLAHQRMSQSRTSLDDSEYTTRFNRLDGLIAQLAFSIRKSWRTLPSWLANSVNKDAVVTGKQEMTAAGRAFISCWLVDEVFDKYFHPDLEPALSAQLKTVQRNIRKYANAVHTADEEDILTAKVVNWRLATLEGLQDALRSPQCPTYRAQMTDMLKEHLCGALAVHLQDPPPSDLEGGVHMIVELVVSIAIHLPLESRDVVIEYFMPSQGILPEQMKVESGIPALVMSIADDVADRASMKSATSEIDGDSNHEQPSKKRGGMLSALTGSGSKVLRGSSSSKAGAGAGGSSSSLQRPESSGKDETPRVRMAAGIGVRIRGRAVLVRAPVFST